ncbi:hypothetical protein P8625_15990 [Tenacibaculum tangerinum]|uniref:DUF1449 family protein n=1 Tax=Tenacibaculum tangerinum TaxID=3038772 RepID=A0ABY8L5W6_9FLAO|nr:hypothetical protein [Tenacibaculum tangerinum]WGH75540.1 hypothetical protein P8625_15990 [Tenacibaculum tangerinum]
MNTFTDIIFSPVNLPLTILVMILLLYWVVTMISGIDFDLDVDVDVDVDMDADFDIDSDSGIEGGNADFHDVSNAEVTKEDVLKNRKKPLKWWQVFLIYFNFVGLPFMFTFTCWIFIWWILTAVLTVLTGSINNSFGFVLMLAGFLPSLFINKIFTTPFKSFFKNLNQHGDAPIDIVGRVGVSLSNIKDKKLGSAEVKAEGTHLSINIKSLDGSPIQYREQILIIKQSQDKSFYYAQSYIN